MPSDTATPAVSALALTGCADEDTTAEVVGPATGTAGEGATATVGTAPTGATATSTRTDSTPTDSTAADADPVSGAAGAATAIATAERAPRRGGNR